MIYMKAPGALVFCWLGLDLLCDGIEKTEPQIAPSHCDFACDSALVAKHIGMGTKARCSSANQFCAHLT